MLLVHRTYVVANRGLKDISKRINRVIKESVGLREGQTMETSQKDLAQQHVIANVQRH